MAHILIVEDSLLVSSAFEVIFEDAGYSVRSAGTVTDAIERGAEQAVDIMLLDLTLPDGSGLDVLEALRQRSALPRKTLAMTGHGDAATRRRCLAAGCADVLLKPVPIRELLRQIELHLK